MVHAGPFANVGLGQSSIIADRLGLKLFDYHVTESGFGTDIGFEKFWNVKCRYSGLTPDAAVLVATVRAVKMHGGGPHVTGGSLPEVYHRPDPGLVEQGCANLVHHINIVKKAGISPVVCLNHFPADSPEEIAIIRRAAEGAGARFALGMYYERGGAGAAELADAVKDACRERRDFKYLYPLAMKLRERVALIAKDIYGADGVSWTPEAAAKAARCEADPRFDDFTTVMVKTQFSLTHDPELKGVPRGWTLPIRDILIYSGAGFLCPVAGGISLMPGTVSDPAFRRIDIDVETGRVTGLHEVE